MTVESRVRHSTIIETTSNPEASMRYLSMVRINEKAGIVPSEKLMHDMGKLMEEMTRNGKLVSTAGLRPTAEGKRVRLRNGNLTQTDGPFAETKEVVGGFAVFEFKSREEAIESAVNFMELHQQHWPGWDGETEVRQILGPEDYPPR